MCLSFPPALLDDKGDVYAIATTERAKPVAEAGHAVGEAA